MKTRAALVLFLLAPFFGEVLSGSTPPLALLNAFALIYLPLLYGGGALVARETVRRRGLGWWAIVLLGAAYGVLEEGLVVTSWQNPYWPDAITLGDYSRALGISWIWALHLTAYHAVVSITIPIVVAEALFGDIAREPWLSDRAYRRTTAVLALTAAAGLLLFGFVAFRAQGYDGPGIGLVIAFVIAAVLVRLALGRRATADVDQQPAPGLWTVRAVAFAGTFVSFVVAWGAPSLFPFAPLALAVLAGIFAALARRVTTWSRRVGWGERHQLALVTGVVAFFVLLAPVSESRGVVNGKPFAGETLVCLVTLVFVAVLARRTHAPVPAAA